MRTINSFLVIGLLSLINPAISILLESVALAGAAYMLHTFRCQLYECCDLDYGPKHVHELKSDLESKLYGQQIARDTVYSAIYSHIHLLNPRKPLVLSFHGLPGSGKNYVVNMTVNALFKKGERSKHYYFFNGRNDFPLENSINTYKEELQNKVKLALNNCERPLFVFDEVDKMPSGILDTLVPFIDYTSWNQNKNKAIFIFLSNTGSNKIVQKMLDLWNQGISREKVSLYDFESIISIGAFNEQGGLHKSGTIESKLIDHYVPFLPLEEKHVIECIKDSFKYWGAPNPSKEDIQEVLKYITYGPPPHNLYSTAGCKRLDHKVSSIVQRKNFYL